MLKKSATLMLPVFALGLAAPASSDQYDSLGLTEKEQTKLDKRLEGRVAGEPVSCIQRRDGEDMTVINDNVILFQRSHSAKTIYLNTPRGGCNRAKDNALVRRSISGSYCSGEIVTVENLVNGIPLGSCSWSEFVPYTKDN